MIRDSRIRTRRLIAAVVVLTAVLSLGVYGLCQKHSSRHIVVVLHNIDDEGVVFVDGQVKLRSTASRAKTADLGWISRDAVIKLKVFNEGGTYAWGLQVSERGTIIAEDAEGITNLVGANEGRSSADGIRKRVHLSTIEADGDDPHGYPGRNNRDTKPKPPATPDADEGFRDWLVAGYGPLPSGVHTVSFFLLLIGVGGLLWFRSRWTGRSFRTTLEDLVLLASLLTITAAVLGFLS